MTATKAAEVVERVTFTFEEFARKFGKNRTWTYRLAAKGKLRVIEGYGQKMVPASEVTRILSEGEGVKP